MENGYCGNNPMYGDASGGSHLGFWPIIVAVLGAGASVAGAALAPKEETVVIAAPQSDNRIPVYMIAGGLGLLILLLLITRR